MNFCSTTISRTFKSATNSSTFENALIMFCLKLPKSSRNAKKKLVAFSKVPLLVALLNVRLIVVLQKFRPYI